MSKILRRILQICSNKFALALLMVLPFPAIAQEVGECDWRASAQAIAEPWEANTRSFAEGEIRLTVIDVGEPAAGSFYLMIMSPPYDEAGRQCRVLAMNADGLGFAGLTMDGAVAGYDAVAGLSVVMPATRWLPDTDTYKDAVLTVTVNQETGAITGMLD